MRLRQRPVRLEGAHSCFDTAVLVPDLAKSHIPISGFSSQKHLDDIVFFRGHKEESNRYLNISNTILMSHESCIFTMF